VSAPVLTTARLILRQIGADDLGPHMALLNSPAVMEHLGGVQPREVIAAKHEASRASFAAHGFGFMLMTERESGAIVGHCGLRHVAHPLAPNPQDHEIGWVVREDRWRRGYAHEAMRAVIDWGFSSHGAPRIVAITTQINVGSWRLMEKLGMIRAPALDFNDPAMSPAYNPAIQYAITRGQWGPDLD
jgi:RimJ/RimL family protein N-acetyltransferase